jgi:glycosyltransferase involved in cell wall biosynthesis
MQEKDRQNGALGPKATAGKESDRNGTSGQAQGGSSNEPRAPLARLAFKENGKPRGWVRKLLFHSDGRVRGIFRRGVYHKDGRPRRAFELWLLENRLKIRPSSLHSILDRMNIGAQASRELTSVPEGAVLVAAEFLPLYDQQSGGLRLMTLIEMIGKQGRPIFFASSLPIPKLPGVIASEEGRQHYEKLLRHFGVERFTYGVEAAEALLAETNVELSHAFLSSPEAAEALLPMVRARQPNARIVYDMVDFHALRMEREAALTGDARLADDAARMKKLELSLVSAADVTIAISAGEKQAILDLAPLAVVDILPNIFEISSDFPPGPGGRRDVLFLGGFWHKPNSDAVVWFVDEIWPRILAQTPGCRFLIAGSNPGPEVLVLSRAPGVEVLGYVGDLEPLYNAARVCVAPLRFGAGVKGKVGQSMAHGLPVVSTSIGAEGMWSQDDEHLLVADDADAFAEKVLQLLRDDDLWIETQALARRFVETHFSVPALNDKVKALFNA